jgi:hypothetical protein
VAAQASAGYLDRRYLGAQADAVWLNPRGDWRVSGTLGSYQHETTGTQHRPALVSARYSVWPGKWQIEATAGEFLGKDAGMRLASVHWFGDTQMKLYYSSTQGEAGTRTEARRRFLGFALSLPLGREAVAMGNTWVRGTDRWNWGLKTKIRERDNNITYGYAEVPQVRHGVLTDVTDHDRSGQADLLGRAAYLRALLQAQQE